MAAIVSVLGIKYLRILKISDYFTKLTHRIN